MASLFQLPTDVLSEVTAGLDIHSHVTLISVCRGGEVQLRGTWERRPALSVDWFHDRERLFHTDRNAKLRFLIRSRLKVELSCTMPCIQYFPNVCMVSIHTCWRGCGGLLQYVDRFSDSLRELEIDSWLWDEDYEMRWDLSGYRNIRYLHIKLNHHARHGLTFGVTVRLSKVEFPPPACDIRNTALLPPATIVALCLTTRSSHDHMESLPELMVSKETRELRFVKCSRRLSGKWLMGLIRRHPWLRLISFLKCTVEVESDLVVSESEVAHTQIDFIFSEMLSEEVNFPTPPSGRVTTSDGECFRIVRTSSGSKATHVDGMTECTCTVRHESLAECQYWRF